MMETAGIAVSEKLAGGYSVVAATGIILAASFVGKGLGFAREMLIARFFGATAETDAYLIAYIVPFLISNMLAGGALQAAFMPVLSFYLINHTRKEAFLVASNVLNVVGISLIFVVVLAMPFTSQLTRIIGAGLSPQAHHLASQLLLITLPALVMLNLLIVSNSILNSMKHFVGPALVPVILSGTIIAFVVFLAPSLGIFAVALGFTGGCLIACLVQIIIVRRLHFEYRLVLQWGHPALRRIAVLLVPAALSSGTAQINLAVDRVMASTLTPGSISALNYGDTAIGIFTGLSIAVAIAMFPALNDLANVEDWEGLTTKLTSVLRFLVFLLTPAAFVLFAMREPLVQVLFQRGRFDQTASTMTAMAVAGFAFGTPCYGIYYVLLRVFYALKDMRTPLIIGAGMVFVNASMNYIGMRYWGHAGIAFSTSVVNVLAMMLLLLALRRHLPAFQPSNLFGYWWTVLLGSVLCASATWLVLHMVAHLRWPPLVAVIVSLVAAFGVYGVFVSALHLPEVATTLGAVKRVGSAGHKLRSPLSVPEQKL